MKDERQIPETGDEALLTEIRDEYKRYKNYWRPAEEHRGQCLAYLQGNPWKDKDRKEREKSGRPCLNHDELNQYVFQAVNPVRQNKKGVKLEPEGDGADEKTAELRRDMVRTIEYQSQAATIYCGAFQDMVEGGYGFCRISRRYLRGSKEQAIVIKPINNPTSVLYDPDYKEVDGRDARGVFVLDSISRADFTRLYPNAEKTSFTSDDMTAAPDWITNDRVMVAERWKVEVTGGRNGQPETRKVTQYVTNGVEILERNPQPGEEIPIVIWVGLQRFCDDGNGVRRVLSSLISRALDPQMSLAYYVSQEAEEAGMTPKVPYIGFVGQFETDAEAWKTATKQAHPFLQADPVLDQAGNLLARPERQAFTPNFSEYEAAKEGARRAVQSAVGASPLPTQAQRKNEKSGVALQQIREVEQIGSFHFIDGHDRAIARVGRIIDSWIPVTYDTEREMWLHKPDESRRFVKLNTAQPYVNEKTGEQEHYPISEQARHSVTVSSGPSEASQRQAFDDFLDLIVQNIETLPITPPQKAKILALAIQQKQLGPKGDEIAEIISPTDQQELPPQAQQAIQASQQQLKALNAYAADLEKKLQQADFEKKAGIVNNEYKLQLQRMSDENKALIAEIETKAQNQSERLAFLEDMWKQFHAQAHEAGMQAQDQVHQQDMAQQAAAQQPQQEQPQPAA